MNQDEYIEIVCRSEIENDFDRPTLVYRMYAYFIAEDAGEDLYEYIPGTASESKEECCEFLKDARLEFPVLDALPLIDAT